MGAHTVRPCRDCGEKVEHYGNLQPIAAHRAKCERRALPNVGHVRMSKRRGTCGYCKRDTAFRSDGWPYLEHLRSADCRSAQRKLGTVHPWARKAAA